MFEAYLEADNACACQSGTAGLHLCLIAMESLETTIPPPPVVIILFPLNENTPAVPICDHQRS